MNGRYLFESFKTRSWETFLASRADAIFFLASSACKKKKHQCKYLTEHTIKIKWNSQGYPNITHLEHQSFGLGVSSRRLETLCKG